MTTRYKGRICICFITYFTGIWIERCSILSNIRRSDNFSILRVLIHLKNTIALFLFSSQTWWLLTEIASILVSRYKPLINDWHVLQITYVVGLYYKNCASNLNYIIHSQRMKVALFTFSREAEPCAISRAYVLQIEAFLPLLRLVCLGLIICNFSMKVTHLGVILDAESILLIPTYSKSKFIHCYYSIPCGAFKYVELYKTFLGGMNHLEFREAHLEHHIRFA